MEAERETLIRETVHSLRAKFQEFPPSLTATRVYLLDMAEDLIAAFDKAQAEIESLKAQLKIAEAFHDVAVKERDYFKVRLAHAEADAEQAVHNEAFQERMKIVAWIRARVAHGSLDSRTSMQALGALTKAADQIERGEHEG